MIATSYQENQKVKRLVDAVQELSLARSLGDVMKIVRKVARELTGADGAAFVLRDGDLCFYADEDAISPLWKGSRFPMDTCISGWSMLNRKAAVIEDIYVDSRIPIDAYRPTFVKSLAMVPIRTMDPIGAIGNYWAQKHRPTEEEVSLLQSLADITAVTLENVRVYNELEQRVAERTVQLEAANKELEAFSYSVSHDLRSPLRSIIGYSNILNEDHYDNLNDEGRRMLSTIQQNAARMNGLIGDLLEFSKLGRKDLEKTEVDMQEIVQDVILEIKTTMGISAHIAIVTPLLNASCDFSLIRQVWCNLLSNAVKYSSKTAEPKIAIGCYQEDCEIIYYVKDNGAGFNMEYAKKLFVVFQRLHKVSEFEGTGIGLALVKRIVDKHGGRTWAVGKLNEGATFYFSLPDTK